jgi:hypothetical protein
MRSKTLSIPLTDAERQLLEAAFSKEKPLGDRGGITAWARQVLLREAKQRVQHTTSAGGKDVA